MSKLKIVDLYCGAGGETTGISQAVNVAGEKMDLAAVNHWQVAMETHLKNHPAARHFLTDISNLNPLHVFEPREHVDLLWASPECTHHSIARGGRPRSEQQRTGAWPILKWLNELYVRRVIIENVPEFRDWGPLGANGKQLKSKRGATFEAYLAAIKSLGYRVEYQILNAANYGDPTTRRRLFIQAVRGRERIRWPDPTHGEHPTLWETKPWISARSIIDWSVPGESIFSRKRPLAEATLRRIEAGIQRFWGEWAEPFLILLRGTSTVRDVDQPVPTITAGGGHVGLVRPFLVPFYGERPGQDPRSHNADKPIPTIPASGSGKFGLIEPFFVQFNAGKGRSPRTQSISQPLRTVTTEPRFGMVQPFILSLTHGGRLHDARRPFPTVTGANRGELATVQPFILNQHSDGRPRLTDEPCPPVTTINGHRVVQGHPYTLDITMRMLLPHELAAAQGFPDGYWFAGNKREQVKQIGNAVPVNTAEALTREALGA